MKQVAGYITRKSMLYVTGVEYGDYTINHVQGCSHGCLYPCYAFMMKKRFGQVKNYEEWLKPYLVSNTLELLDKEIPLLRDKITSVQLCFSTDPFMYGYREISRVSISVIRRLNDAGIRCTVLTKGILPVALMGLSRENEYGITVVSLEKKFHREMEPFSAPVSQRIAALRRLHDAGCRTWVSIEPYPTPNIIRQNLNDILDAVSFVDRIVFGRMNYNKKVSEYKDYKAFYNKQAADVEEYGNNNKISVHIKDKTITSDS